MYCGKCGKTVAANENFCQHCGERIRNESFTPQKEIKQNQPSVFFNLIGIAIATFFLFVAFALFNTSLNGRVSEREAYEAGEYGMIYFVIGAIIAIIAIYNWYRKKK